MSCSDGYPPLKDFNFYVDVDVVEIQRNERYHTDKGKKFPLNQEAVFAEFVLIILHVIEYDPELTAVPRT